MSTELKDTSLQYSDEKKALIQKQREKWKSVNYGETESNLAKYNRQVGCFGRIKYW